MESNKSSMRWYWDEQYGYQDFFKVKLGEAAYREMLIEGIEIWLGTVTVDGDK